MSFRHLQTVTGLAFLLFLCSSCGAGQSRQIQANDQACEPASGRQCLTPNGEALLDGLIDAGKLPELHRLDFSAYRNEVKKFYKSLNGSLGWIQRNKPTAQARALIDTLDKAVYKGLRPEDYDSPQWDKRLALIEQAPNASESELLNFDLALTVSGMRYILDLHNGRVNPRLFRFDFDIDHTKFDLSAFLRQELVDSQDIDAALALVEPPFPVYRRTEAALKTYLELARRDEGDLFPVLSKTIKPGDSYPGAPLLVKKLALLGDVPEEQGPTEKFYNDALVNGVKHFQRRHGLEPNGLIDAATVKELNTPLSRRVMQFQLTLERLRWLPHEFDRPPIVVNIPEFRLHADNEDYHWVLSMKVVVGGAYEHRTPVFASAIKSVIFRPY
jgi:murein L,D-transpeptidase YcbB/YkuD